LQIAALSEAELEPAEALWQTSLAFAFDTLGRKADADRELSALQCKHALRSTYQIVEVLAARGNLVQAFEWLDRAYRQHDSGLIKLTSNPLLKPEKGCSLATDSAWTLAISASWSSFVEVVVQKFWGAGLERNV
jgi:hypothetical protein